MRIRMNILFLLLLLFSADIAHGDPVNKTKTSKSPHKHTTAKPALRNHSDRAKRSIDDKEDPFWPNRGKKLLTGYSNLEIEPPFWATRGRRDSSSDENFPISNVHKAYKPFFPKSDKFCENCTPHGYLEETYGDADHVTDDLMTPFWGHRGRRSSEELTDRDVPDDLFWGSRGRRQENEPFWGNRGRRDEEPFWGNRGRREETPFWGHRGRRDDMNPFWGNRGRREESDPFWGNRGRRGEDEPFWGNRGRRREGYDPLRSGRGRRKEDLKESILNAINVVENDIENLSRLRRSAHDNSFWPNRPRESKSKHLFSSSPRTKPHQSFLVKPSGLLSPLEPGTVHDNRMFAEEPHYIIVERTSRSSGEVDPFYISRGKKYYSELDLAKAARDRRGAIEDIVKSVRNDPYYIARGKKDSNVVKIGNATMSHEAFAKAKGLICATVELIIAKSEAGVSKREADESERDRRTMLKKLAAQLQMDPYFVSRGKKSDRLGTDGDDYLQDFIDDVATKCTQ